MVRITISETYDLSTKLNKMSLIGIHTPDIGAITKVYGGLVSNAKMIRYTKCDVKLACASVLPADPLQVGVEAGDIAPQDMFNPILYKAVSNQAMNQFELRMHGIQSDALGRFLGSSIDKTDSILANGDTGIDDFKVYYTLLSNRKGFKVAHPQRGLSMMGLRPFVYEKLYNVGDTAEAPANDSHQEYFKDISLQENDKLGGHSQVATAVRGRPRPLPALPIHTLTYSSSSKNSMPYNEGDFDQLPWFKGLRIYTGLIIMPPAKLNRFFYRLVVRWHVDLIGIRPYNDIVTFGQMEGMAPTFYGSDYFPITGSKDNQLGMVDVEAGDVDKIMEGI